MTPTRYDRLRSLFDEAGLDFSPPPRIPNTRRALATAEWVRRTQPSAFDALDRALYRAHFANGLFLGDPDVVDALVAESGADAAAVRAAVEAGDVADALRSARQAAWDAGVTGTPAWLLDNRLLVPGAQPRETIERIVRRLLERPA